MKINNVIINVIVIFGLIFSPTIFAGGCDWTQIKKNPDGTYTYSEKLHLCVGKLVKSSQTQTKQVADLTKALSLKDLSIQDSDKRAQTWMETSGALEKRVQEADKLEHTNEFLFFGLGILATGIAAFTANKLR